MYTVLTRVHSSVTRENWGDTRSKNVEHAYELWWSTGEAPVIGQRIRLGEAEKRYERCFLKPSVPG
ncbi:hypothetical protein SCP_0700250 [Sparassis crispa]|uniref:Uncharacterized protein n=1 Tax=Sparassis crispa TaxID=139825 RepID=A0A401GRK0_9APHY|nr:hypothetical protein SCP_0700250 [Sparassis crispa]GBE84845.1 hypothetical protein SCP_0700250 [Sparassis crispa]